MLDGAACLVQKLYSVVKMLMDLLQCYMLGLAKFIDEDIFGCAGI